MARPTSGRELVGNPPLHLWAIGAELPHIARDETGRFWVAICGDPELRTSAKPDAERHDSSSFAAEVLRGLLITGDGFVQNLQGPCTIVLCDLESRSIKLWRDRSGLAQMFVRAEDSYLAFCSDLNVLADITGPGEISPYALSFYLAYGHSPRGQSAFHPIGKAVADRMAATGKGDRSLRLVAESASQRAMATEAVVISRAAEIAAFLPVDLRGARAAVLAPFGAGVNVLHEAALAAGASSAAIYQPRYSDAATPSGPNVVPVHIESNVLLQIGRFTASAAQPIADIRHLVAMALADATKDESDHLLLPYGAEQLALTAPRYEAFAASLARAGAAKAGISNAALFKRDLYFKEIALCSDEMRTLAAGPELVRFNGFAMADELGGDLEGASTASAAKFGSEADFRLTVPEAVVPSLDAIAGISGKPVHAPYLRSRSLRRPVAVVEPLRSKLALGPMEMQEPPLDAWVSEQRDFVFELLENSLAKRDLIARGFIQQLLHRHFKLGYSYGILIWALCCLEVWCGSASDGVDKVNLEQLSGEIC